MTALKTIVLLALVLFILIGIDYFYLYPGSECDWAIYIHDPSPGASYYEMCQTYIDYLWHTWNIYWILMHLIMMGYILVLAMGYILVWTYKLMIFLYRSIKKHS